MKRLLIIGGLTGLAVGNLFAPDIFADVPGTNEAPAATRPARDSGSGMVDQFSATGMDLGEALRFISLQGQKEVVVDWDALDKAGAPRGKLTINLYNRTFDDALEILASMIRPTSGYAGFKLENGKYHIGPQASPIPEDARDKELDAAIAGKLKEKIKLDGEPITFGSVVSMISLMSKLDAGIDMVELAKSGVTMDSKIKLEPGERSIEEWLKAVFAAAQALPESKEPLGFKIEYGMLRVTTKAAAEGKVAATRP